MGLFSKSKKAEETTSQPPSAQSSQPRRVRGVGLDNPVPVYNNNNNNNNGNNSRKPAIQDVAGVIGYSCAQRAFDFSYILALCDYISLSANESAKAAKAIRKELKYAIPDAQERACRLVGIMCRNSDIRFKQEIASKKFLGVLSDLATGKKTEPKVVAMILRVLSPLAFEYQYDRDLLPITTLYNKLKSSDDPINGLPLAEDDTLFTPTTVVPRTSRQQYQTEMPSREEQLKWLQRKANEAKGNASMLTEALAFAENGDLEGNELVAEFYAKCFASQETITSNLDWCSVEAEKSRLSIPTPIPAPASELPPLDALSISSTPPTTTTHYKSHNPFAPIIEASIPSPRVSTPVIVTPAQQEPTEEEMTYSMLLSSHSDIIEALHLHSSILATSKEAIELKKIQERSKEEIRTDSNGNWLELSPPTSPITPVEVSSGSGSYDNGISAGNGNNRQSLSSTNPYARYQAPSSPTPVSQINNNNNNNGGYMMDEQEQQELDSGDGTSGAIWEPLTPTKASSPPAVKYSNLEVEGYSDEPTALEVQEEEGSGRLGPSDKALGKLRKVSVREDANGVDQQAALEEALRAKYRNE